MATAENWRNQGIGTELFHFAIANLDQDDLLKAIWCNARVRAVGIYERLGWQVVSDEFEYGNAGRSVTMVWGCDLKSDRFL